jgi:Flp pilus assembly protein TadD
LSRFVRASAVQRLAGFPGAGASTLQRAIEDPHALVRAAAVSALSAAEPALRAQLLARKLDDPVRLVRIDAARALAREPEARLSSDDRSLFERALAEYVAALRFNADRPEAQSALGSLYAARGRVDDAVVAYREALKLDPTFVQAAVNLADLQRGLGREADAEATIRAALKTSPQSAAARHALGLSLVRQKRVPEALAELAMASKLAPDNARFAFVYAVALNDTGRRAEAIKVLRAALTRNSYDREILRALALYENAAGEAAQARGRARLLTELEPANPDFARLAEQLGAAASPR